MPLPKRPIRTLLASAAALAASAFGTAHAQTSEQGLPMWVIKDADSTIYLTGTIHALPPEVQWDSQKLRDAVKHAGELWLEIPMGSDVMKFAAEAAPIMMRHAMATTPLDKMLAPEETASLKARIAELGLPAETFTVINMMKPWYASMLIGVSPLINGGYDPTQGIDVKIAKLAEDDGDPIKGFETVEEQTKILGSGSIDEQLTALRHLLSIPKAGLDATKGAMDELALTWARGDISGATKMFANLSETDEAMFGGAKMDSLLLNRNENWAGQIETMLKGAGTHLIAVGGAHLVGPDSVQERLKLRGIATERY